MSTHDSYHLNQRSPHKKPGFVTFQDKASTWHFLYNDQEGEPLLFSVGYPSEDKCRHGVNLVRRNFTKPDRYKTIKVGDALHFVIRAGNNREISRSRPFSSKNALGNVLKRLQREVSGAGKEPKKRMEPKESPFGQSLQGVQKESEPKHAGMSTRFRFNLTFRRAGKNEPLRGEIDYPLTREKATFEGVDLDALAAFIMRHLPEGSARPLSTEKDAQIAADRGKPQAEEPTLTRPEMAEDQPEHSKAGSLQAEAPQEAPLQQIADEAETPQEPPKNDGERSSARSNLQPLHFEIMDKDMPHAGYVFRHTDKAQISMQVAEGAAFSEAGQSLYRVSITARLLDRDRKEFVVLERQGILPQNGHIIIPLTLRNFRPGLYRMSSLVSLLDGKMRNGSKLRLEGSKIVQIF